MRVKTLVEEAGVIAMIGASPSPYQPSNMVMRFLLERGYEVIPVRPDCESILGCPCVRHLSEISRPIDIVNVFRRSEAVGECARDAAAAGARTLWLQEGIRSDEARLIAERAGMNYVEDRCIKKVILGAG